MIRSSFSRPLLKYAICYLPQISSLTTTTAPFRCVIILGDRVSGMHCHLLLNGYNSNSQSPSDPGGLAKSPQSPPDALGQADDDPHSPAAPLSLITNHSSSPQPPHKDSPSPADTTQVTS